MFFLAPLSVDFFKDTNYARCVVAIDEVCRKSFDRGRSQEFDKLFNQALGSSDFPPILQSYLSGFKKKCDLLKEKSDRALERSDIDQLFELYGRISGDYEKGVRMNAGMLRILEGEDADYGKVSGLSLGVNVQFLKKMKSILVQNFSNVIRNSIAHGNFFISLSTETVTFKDKDKTEVVTFKDLLLKCKMLIASTTALTLAPAIFMPRRWDIIWERYKASSGQAPIG